MDWFWIVVQLAEQAVAAGWLVAVNGQMAIGI
jgi:hypothetical protein